MSNDTTQNVRAFVYTTLNGNVTHNSSPVPILNRATDRTTYPYILVVPQGYVDVGTKDKFGGTHEINVEIHYRYKLNEGGGYDDVDSISNTITGLLRLRQQTSDFTSDFMHIWKLTNHRYLEDDDEQYFYVRKILTFEAEVMST